MKIDQENRPLRPILHFLFPVFRHLRILRLEDNAVPWLKGGGLK